MYDPIDWDNPEKWMNDLPKILTNFINEYDWALEYIASELGIGKLTVGQWAAGKVIPDHDMAINILDIIDKEMNESWDID